MIYKTAHSVSVTLICINVMWYIYIKRGSGKSGMLRGWNKVCWPLVTGLPITPITSGRPEQSLDSPVVTSEDMAGQWNTTRVLLFSLGSPRLCEKKKKVAGDALCYRAQLSLCGSRSAAANQVAGTRRRSAACGNSGRQAERETTRKRHRNKSFCSSGRGSQFRIPPHPPHFQI